jgi:hypothetical protein
VLKKNYAVSSAKRIKRSAANSGYLSTGLQKKEHPKQRNNNRLMVFWKEDESSLSTASQPQLVSAPTRKAAGAGGRSTELTFFAKRSVPEAIDTPGVRAY